MKRIIAFLLAAIMLLSAAGCASSPAALNPDIKPQSVVGTSSDELFESALTDFSVELFKNSASDKNTVMSPLSVMLALAMVQNGAKGETLAQMQQVLGNMDADTLNSYLYSYAAALRSDSNISFNIANSIWLRDSIAESISDDFLQKNADYYSSDVFTAPFDNKTCSEINGWISKQTDGLITNMLSSIPESTIMYLINAIVFDGKWSEPYEAHQIHDGLFTSSDGMEQKVEMMCSSESSYLDDGAATGFIKSYEGGKYTFAALLPNEGTSIKDYVASLTGSSLRDTLKNASYDYEVIAKLPKFKSEFTVSLTGILSDMGMEDLFTSKADLSGMNNGAGGLFVSDVMHKGFIEVDQAGTKAGAATIVAVDECCMIEDEVVRRYVTLDRPFVYAIIDRETYTPIFLGVLNSAE